MKARIGITATRSLDGDRLQEATNHAYVSAIRRAGGTPFVLPVLHPADAADVVHSLDGLVLSGGGDVNPFQYGAPAVAEVYGVDNERDAYELALLEAALDLNMPVLGICRGLQLINVACGGKLVQHLPTLSELPHRDEKHFAEPVHSVQLSSHSRLAGVIGRSKIGVNSLHHQAVSQIGSGLYPVGWAPDGIVEAIESSDRRLIGVQWHPELLGHDASHAALFAWLVSEAVRPIVLALPAPEPQPSSEAPVSAVA